MSIGARLTRSLLLAMIPLVLAAGVGLYVFVRAALQARVDDALFTRAAALSALVKFEAGAIELDFTAETSAMIRHDTGSGHAEYYELWTLEKTGAKTVLERSASLGGEDLALPPDHGIDSVPANAWNGPLAGGHEGRLAARRFTPAADPEAEERSGPAIRPAAASTPEVLLIVAQSRRDLDRTLGVLGAALAGAGAVLIVGMTIAVRGALSRGLSPIADLVDQVEAIGPTDLTARIGLAGTPLELAPLALRTNAMLDRLASAFAREKRLGATAAHELRTPIAEIRAVSELALSRERTPGEYRRSLSTVLSTSVRMGDAADAILRLARVQSGRERPVLEPVDAVESLLPAWERWISPLESRHIRVLASIPAGTLVRADRAMLGVVFDNLCANAAEHTPEGGEVSADRSDANHPEITLIITNTISGPRGDHPIPDGTGQLHAGLGLLLARSMLEACDGSLATREENGQFVATIRIGPVAS